MESLIQELAKLLSEDGHRDTIDNIEDIMIESIDEIVKNDVFYTLPTNEILTILRKSDIESSEMLCNIARKMSSNKGHESQLLLNVIDPKEATFDECVKIISSFTECTLCMRKSVTIT